MKAFLWLLSAAAVAVSAVELPAQQEVPMRGTTPVAPTDPVYRDVDRLAQLGLLDGVILGQRPYSRRELARIAARARRRALEEHCAARRARQLEAILECVAASGPETLAGTAEDCRLPSGEV